MKFQVVSIFVIALSLSFWSCSDKSANSNTTSNPSDTIQHLMLTEAQAKGIFELPIHCLEVEYPNKLGQVLGSDADLKSPKQLRPIFYGCFDWHSSVHGYWSIVELMQKYPDLDSDGKIRNILNKHITPENVAVELAFFNDENNKNFERTYGWAWLFKLQESLSNWQDEDAQRWEANLQPLADLLVKRYIEYLPKLIYPIRAGQHDNSAFGLSLSIDYARSVGNKDFENAIIKHGKRLFLNDINCDLAYEPSGYDFLSPCLEEAYLMSKILEQQEYKTWLGNFMPGLFKVDYRLDPAVVKDRSDGKLVHLDGLNYSRAACLYGISSKESELNHLKKIANEHIKFSLPNLSVQDDYMGSHWLGTFALYALSHAN
ncbi:MAG: DUF2891 domain-containing protein [Sphingobacterium composti]|uniref:DUF2891 domain-containing protein n=1 Tax=Sphingobacterium composti TaxID=363260 RepID=UPI00135CB3FE|nr:DUF2891 domain-containing protein [Sphingobacterium composti Ten et al. 2007 non Yoo et al. 2007]